MQNNQENSGHHKLIIAILLAVIVCLMLDNLSLRYPKKKDPVEVSKPIEVVIPPDYNLELIDSIKPDEFDSIISKVIQEKLRINDSILKEQRKTLKEELSLDKLRLLGV